VKPGGFYRTAFRFFARRWVIGSYHSHNARQCRCRDSVSFPRGTWCARVDKPQLIVLLNDVDALMDVRLSEIKRTYNATCDLQSPREILVPCAASSQSKQADAGSIAEILPGSSVSYSRAYISRYQQKLCTLEHIGHIAANLEPFVRHPIAAQMSAYDPKRTCCLRDGFKAKRSLERAHSL
jgi:hypothetical protein